jgi:hypothetical protein
VGVFLALLVFSSPFYAAAQWPGIGANAFMAGVGAPVLYILALIPFGIAIGQLWWLLVRLIRRAAI